jgi:endonuclease-3
MKKQFPTWESVLNAPRSKLENAIRVGGLANSKSKYIQSILRSIKAKYGQFKLDHLRQMPVRDALNELTSLPGVGLKTASCVLLFSFGRPAMPVDTHVGRLSRRLGLVTEKSTAEHTFEVLMELTPEELVYPFHLHLIRHGREVCKSQKPKCRECVLADLCPSVE